MDKSKFKKINIPRLKKLTPKTVISLISKLKDMDFKSISGKLVVYFSILILLFSISIGLISIQRSSSTLINEAEKSIITISNESAKTISSRLETESMIIEMIAKREEIKRMNWFEQQPVLRNQVMQTGLQEFGIIHLDGSVSYLSGIKGKLDDNDPILEALEGKENIISFSVNPLSDEQILLFATPIKNNGKVVGALLGRRNGSALSTITRDTGYGEEGYGYIINSKGTIIAHKDINMVLSGFNPLELANEDNSYSSLAKLFEKILTERSGISEYTYNEKKLYAGYSPIENTDWTMVIAASRDEVLSGISILRSTIFIVVLSLLLLGIVATYIIGRSISKPIINAVEHAKIVASLDITQDIPESYMKKKDETGQLSKALHELTVSLRQIVSEVNESSQQLSTASQELKATSGLTATAVEEVTRTVEDIARGASEQAINTEVGSTKTNLLGELIGKNHIYTNELTKASKKVTHTIDEGLVEIEHLNQANEESNKAAKGIFDVILKTHESSNKIGEASEVIEKIADKTNLLALNAAIEAARAGDAGRGFAVVADEIRKLAEQSSISSKSINKIVSELQKNSINAVKTMERVGKIVEEQTQRVINSKEKYLLISDAMNSEIESVNQLYHSGKNMESMKNEILDTLQALTAIAEENSAATQETSASLEEQTASIEEIAGASEDLANLANNLQTIITKFKI